MKKNRIAFVVLALAVALGVGACWWIMSWDEVEPGKRSAGSEGADKSNKKPRLENEQRQRSGKYAALRGKDGKAIAGKEKVKPSFRLDDDEEAHLNDEQRKMIQAIRDALADNDRGRVLKLVQKLQKSKEWPDGIPKSIKMAAIEALGWFGSSCLPEIAGFLADGDDEVIQEAVDKFEEALMDVDLSDFERSAVLVQAAKVINDAESLDSMMFELNNMRHSVAIATLKEIMVNGNAAAKSVLADNIEFYTGEEGLDSPEKLDEWLARNPDDPDDEEFYGGTKN